MPSKYDEVIEALDWAKQITTSWKDEEQFDEALTHLQELKETQNLNDFMEEQE